MQELLRREDARREEAREVARHLGLPPQEAALQRDRADPPRVDGVEDPEQRDPVRHAAHDARPDERHPAPLRLRRHVPARAAQPPGQDQRAPGLQEPERKPHHQARVDQQPQLPLADLLEEVHQALDVRARELAHAQRREVQAVRRVTSHVLRHADGQRARLRVERDARRVRRAAHQPPSERPPGPARRRARDGPDPRGRQKVRHFTRVQVPQRPGHAHQVRRHLDQVPGHARRLGRHDALPAEQRPERRQVAERRARPPPQERKRRGHAAPLQGVEEHLHADPVREPAHERRRQGRRDGVAPRVRPEAVPSRLS